MRYFCGYLLIAATIISTTKATCPSGCFCPSGQITCEPGSLTRIPNNVDRNISYLSLKNNRFTVATLTKADFSHLKNLRELTLSGCGIETIQPNTFIDLKELTLLDLEFNNLRSISPDTFVGLNLKYLFLGANPGIVLPPNGFSGMSTEVLDLKNCQLTELSSSFFTPLIVKLRKLFVNGNRIKRFSYDMLPIFEKLESIRMNDNPLACDCQSRWLKRFYDANTDKIGQRSEGGSKYEPRCNEPNSVASEFFNRLAPSDFLCEKPSLNSEISFSRQKAILKCTTPGSSSTKISWYKPNGMAGGSSTTTDGVTEARIELQPSDPQTHGSYRCMASNEAGNVSLSMNMTWSTLGASEQPCANSATTTKEVLITSGDKAGQNNSQLEETDVFKKKYFTVVDIIIAVFGTFAGTLVVTVVVLHICVYRKRKSSSQYSTPPQSEYSNASMNNEVYPPGGPQNMPIHSMQHMQNRPLPSEPYHKAYDENHYMSTQLSDGNDLVRLGQHNSAALVSPHSPTCQACHTINAHHRHSQAL